MTDTLFIYGTLLSESKMPMAEYVAKHTSFIQVGTMQGKLYDLGTYPGAVYDPEEPNVIKGRIVCLHDPETAFPLLDRYEACDLQSPKPYEFIRVEVPIETKSGSLTCWVYLYNWDPLGMPEIESGDYADFLAQSGKTPERDIGFAV